MTQNQQAALFFAGWWACALLTWLWIRWRMQRDAADDRARREQLLSGVPQPTPQWAATLEIDMDEFKFPLGQMVAIKVSGETGDVIARAQYLTSECSYYLRYQSADGRAVEAWWAESALTTP